MINFKGIQADLEQMMFEVTKNHKKSMSLAQLIMNKIDVTYKDEIMEKIEKMAESEFNRHGYFKKEEDDTSIPRT